MAKNKTGKKIFITVVALVVMVLMGAGYAISSFNEEYNELWTPLEINSENLPSILKSFKLVSDLPENSRIQISVGDNSYIVEKGDVQIKDVNDEVEVDVKIGLSEEYFKVFGEKGWCEGLKEASGEGDLQVEIEEGRERELLWKYKGLVKYKSCLG